MEEKIKLLYIDVPFACEKGGDKSRSRFIWKTLSNQFQCDLLLIRHFKDLQKEVKKHIGYENLYFLETTKS
ncbi:MAG: hypothetical protein SVM86_05070, partial [Candidatus Cloacimonadota bacterium]|nr:hypothetical protein [Candidatus Cloacimonadota bacterium]